MSSKLGHFPFFTLCQEYGTGRVAFKNEPEMANPLSTAMTKAHSRGTTIAIVCDADAIQGSFGGTTSTRMEREIWRERYSIW